MLGWNAGVSGAPVPHHLCLNAQRAGDGCRATEGFDEFGVGHGEINTRYVDIVNPHNTWRELSGRARTILA